MRESGERGEGFIAPYAYFVVSVVEIGSGTVLRRALVTESHAIGNMYGNTPWTSLTPEQKQRALEFVLQQGLRRAMPGVLKG